MTRNINLNILIRQAQGLVDAANREFQNGRRLLGQILREQTRARVTSSARDDRIFVTLEGNLPAATQVSATEITPGQVDATQWVFDGPNLVKLPASRGKIVSPQGVYNTATDTSFNQQDNQGRDIIYAAHRDYVSGRWSIGCAAESPCDTNPTGCQCVDNYNVCALTVLFRLVDFPEASGNLKVEDGSNPPSKAGYCDNCLDWNQQWRLHLIEDTGTTCKFAVGQVGGGFTIEPTAPADACFPCVDVGGNAGLVLTFNCLPGQPCAVSAQLDLYLPGVNNEACIIQNWYFEPFDPTFTPVKFADNISKVAPPTLTTEPCYRPAGSCADTPAVWPTCSSTATWSAGQTYQVGDYIKNSASPAQYFVVTGGTGPSSGNDSDLAGGSDPGYTYSRKPSDWAGFFDQQNCLHRSQEFNQVPQLFLWSCGDSSPTNDSNCQACPRVGFRAQSTSFVASTLPPATVAPVVRQPYPGAFDDHGWDLPGIQAAGPEYAEVEFTGFNTRRVTNDVACTHDILLRYEHAGANVASTPGLLRIFWDASTGKPISTYTIPQNLAGLDGPLATETFGNYKYVKIGEMQHDALTTFTVRIRGDAGVNATLLIFEDLVFRRQP